MTTVQPMALCRGTSFTLSETRAAQTGSPRLELADLGATRKHSAFVADLLHNAAIDSVAFQETVEVAGERGDVLHAAASRAC